MYAYNYQEIVAASERVAWRVEDVIGGQNRLDFGRNFMPESLARVQGLDFLSAKEKRILNQIRGHTYLYIFGLVEEFILPFVMDHTRPLTHGDSARTRAYLQFATDEAKHMDLFKRFRREFVEDFGHDIDVIGPAPEIARAVLAHDKLGVALAVLHIEWMVLKHWQEAARDDESLDPMFKNLLKHHWMDEAQHAKLDTMMVEAMAADLDEEARMKGIEAYLSIGGLIDGGLQVQVRFDLDAFQRATGRVLSREEYAEAERVQLQANRWTYLGTGMTHPKVVASLRALTPAGAEKIAAVAPMFS